MRLDVHLRWVYLLFFSGRKENVSCVCVCGHCEVCSSFNVILFPPPPPRLPLSVSLEKPLFIYGKKTPPIFPPSSQQILYQKDKGGDCISKCHICKRGVLFLFNQKQILNEGKKKNNAWRTPLYCNPKKEKKFSFVITQKGVFFLPLFGIFIQNKQKKTPSQSPPLSLSPSPH